MLPFLYFLALAAVAGAILLAVRHVNRDPQRRGLDTVPTVIGIGAVGLTLLVVAMQLTVQPGGELRHVLTAGVVCGGVLTTVFATWLNYRRYHVEEARQLLEREKADLEGIRHQIEQEKVHLEHEKDRREHEKVADENLMRAVELLGHTDARVRASALHAMASLAKHRPDRAQEVVELICLYLRTAPADGGDGAQREAQKVLLQVVTQANRATPPGREPEVDLAGARLDQFSFGQVSIAMLDLTGAHLSGPTSLRGLRLTLGDDPHQVTLDSAVFEGDVSLHGVRLRRLSATGARFDRALSLEGAVVEREVLLADCLVGRDIDLGGATFGTLNCTGATFGGMANLRRTELLGGGTLLQARFAQADFGRFSCANHVVFDEVHFEESLRLDPALLPDVSLRNTTVSVRAAASSQFQLPPGWWVEDRGHDSVRYLRAA